MILITPDQSQTIKPESLNYDFDLDAYELNEGDSSGAPVVVNDLEFSTITSATQRKFAQATVPQPGKGFEAVFTSSDESLATVDSEGLVRSVATGQAKIYCQIRSRKKVTPFDASVVSLPNQTAATGYVEDSLGEHIVSETNAKLTGSVEYNMYSSGQQRNSGMWAADLDWTGVSYRDLVKDNNQTIRTTTAISRRHILFATHALPANNSIIRYVTADSQQLTRIMTSSLAVGNDISVGLLDEELPESICHYKIMPENWSDYLSIRNELNLPNIHVTRGRQVRIRWRTRRLNSNFPETAFAAHNAASNHSYELRQGDSSNPYFHLINGELVLLGSNSGNYYSFTPSFFISEINAAMATLGGSYSLETIDLSGFPNYA